MATGRVPSTHIYFLGLDKAAVVGDNNQLVAVNGHSHTMLEAGVQQIQHEILLSIGFNDLPVPFSK